MTQLVRTIVASGPETRGPLEASKHRLIVSPYTRGDGLDLGPSHDPITGFAIRIDHDPDCAHIAGDVRRLKWFFDEVFDFVHASHVLEDFQFEEWPAILAEWARVIKPDGFLIVAVPDHERFRAAVRAGQPDNRDHRHESHVGELTRMPFFDSWRVLMHGFVSDDPREYSILLVVQKGSAVTRSTGMQDEPREISAADFVGKTADEQRAILSAA